MSEQPPALSLDALRQMQAAEDRQRLERCAKRIQAALEEERCRIVAVVQAHPTADATAVVVRGAGWVLALNE